MLELRECFLGLPVETTMVYESFGKQQRHHGHDVARGQAGKSLMQAVPRTVSLLGGFPEHFFLFGADGHTQGRIPYSKVYVEFVFHFNGLFYLG